MDSIFSLPEPEVDYRVFERAKSLLHKRAGLVLGDHKRDMTERELGIRSKVLKLATTDQYLDYLEQNAAAPEWQEFINIFTVNHTAFFREPHHFDILARFAKTRDRPLSIWSATCSTGEEPYSIAIRLCDTLSNPGYLVTVLATDIDTEAIAAARVGMYTQERVKPVSELVLRKHFLRGTGTRAGMVRVKPDIRNMVEFDVMNLLAPVWPLDLKFDAVFCRNTLIYFDKPTQRKILDRFARVMKPGGLLFVGHSESLAYLTDAFSLKGQTVYEVRSK